MLYYEDFIAQTIGKSIKYKDSHVSSYECTDYAAKYNNEVVGAPNVSDGNGAKDWFNNAPDAFYIKIKNTATAKPQAGDLVVWNNGKYGHIGIANGEGIVQGKSTDWFVSYDQNWSGRYVQKIHHDFGGVVGFLRPKKNVFKPAPVVSNNFTVTVTKDRAYVRTQPNTQSSTVKQPTPSGLLEKGNTFTAVAVVTGETVYGINKWLKSAKGNYVHASGMKY